MYSQERPSFLIWTSFVSSSSVRQWSLAILSSMASTVLDVSWKVRQRRDRCPMLRD